MQLAQQPQHWPRRLAMRSMAYLHRMHCLNHQAWCVQICRPNWPKPNIRLLLRWRPVGQIRARRTKTRWDLSCAVHLRTRLRGLYRLLVAMCILVPGRLCKCRVECGDSLWEWNRTLAPDCRHRLGYDRVAADQGRVCRSRHCRLHSCNH